MVHTLSNINFYIHRAQFAAYCAAAYNSHDKHGIFYVYTSTLLYDILTSDSKLLRSSDLLKEQSRNDAVEIEIQEQNATGEETYSGLVIINDI